MGLDDDVARMKSLTVLMLLPMILKKGEAHEFGTGAATCDSMIVAKKRGHDTAAAAADGTDLVTFSVVVILEVVVLLISGLVSFAMISL